jgi:hypothetical protein
MNKVEEIFKSWSIAFNPNDEQFEKAQKRLQICNACENKKEGALGSYCGLCGCLLKAKIYSPEENACPIQKW